MGYLDKPTRADPVLDRIAQRGQQHEARFLASLRSDSVAVVEIDPSEEMPFRERVARGHDATLSAMREGADVIYQAVLFDGRRLGYADFLVRVEQASDLGPWRYEVWDTKLARYAKASAVLQISMYSDMVAGLQGRLPEEMHLALGGVQAETVSFRVADFAAYYRLVAREFEAMLHRTEVFPVETSPEPVGHCDICRWSLRCRAEWRANDDLSLVAGLTSRQRRALHGAGVTTRTGLAEPAEPLPERLDGAGRDALGRIPRPSEHPGSGRTHRRGDLRAHRAPTRPRGRPRAEPGVADAPGSLAWRPVLRYGRRPLLQLG